MDGQCTICELRYYGEGSNDRILSQLICGIVWSLRMLYNLSKSNVDPNVQTIHFMGPVRRNVL